MLWQNLWFPSLPFLLHLHTFTDLYFLYLTIVTSGGTVSGGTNVNTTVAVELPSSFPTSSVQVKSILSSLGLSLSSNFRTVGQVNNGHGAPAPMEVGKGVEFRIFDQFDDHYVKDLVLFLSLIIFLALSDRKRFIKFKNVFENNFVASSLISFSFALIISAKSSRKLCNLLALMIGNTFIHSGIHSQLESY